MEDLTATPPNEDDTPTQEEFQRRLDAHPEVGAKIDEFLAHPETGVRLERPARRVPTFGPDLEEISQDYRRLDRDSEARGVWGDSIERLLPAHTYHGTGPQYRWTTPRGTWKLSLNYRGFGSRVTIDGPDGTWSPVDHRAEYVAAFLRLVGAIE